MEVAGQDAELPEIRRRSRTFALVVLVWGTMSWQKLLVLNQEFARKYRQVVLLDSDIAINATAAPRISWAISPANWRESRIAPTRRLIARLVSSWITRACCCWRLASIRRLGSWAMPINFCAATSPTFCTVTSRD